jgi:TRAP-type mannitol/chloroaromatic compound transport system substrate-binding protein
VLDVGLQGLGRRSTADYSTKHPTWAKAFEPYSKFRDETIRWFKLAEDGYDTFMATTVR